MKRETKKTRLKEMLMRFLGEGYKILFPNRPYGADEDQLLLGIMKSGEVSGILVHLENSEFECLKDEEGIQKAAIKLLEEYKRKREFLGAQHLTLSDFQSVKSKVMYVLEGESENTAALSHIPYRRLYDMVLYYQLYVEGEEESCYKTVVNEDLEQWHISEPELYELAMANTRRLFPPVVQVMKVQEGRMEPVTVAYTAKQLSDYIASRQELRYPMFALTSSQGWYGAGCILYRHLLEAISDIINDSLIILPINIHHVVFIPNRISEIHLSELRELMRLLRYLGKSEVLSSYIYLFDRTDKTLKIMEDKNCRA